MKWIFRLSGIVFIFFALLAYWLGFDNNPDWGKNRWAAFLLGVFLLLISDLFNLWKLFVRRINQTSTVKKWVISLEKVKNSPPLLGIRNAKATQFFTQPGIRSVNYLAAGMVLAGWLTAWWLISSGTMLQFPTSTIYFDKLADSFLTGQLHLLETPDPRLAALENPYDYTQRAEIPTIWDATYFNNRYYLYWGPVPAIIAALYKFFHPTVVSDLTLTLLFVLGTMAILGWLIAAGYRKWFANLPAGVVLPPLLAAIFSTPLLWQLPRPSVYEAAISGGQFFWLAGLTWMLIGSTSVKSKGFFMFLAGLSWALAVGCRVNLAAQIASAGLVLFFCFITRPEARRKLILSLVGLTLGLAGLAWYNHTRFGSILETGYSYQLTGPAAISVVEGKLYSPDYFLPNLYNTFFRPPDVDGEFPFLHSTWIREDQWPFYIKIPRHYYYSEPIAGLLLTIPFVWFLPLVFLWKPTRLAVWLLLLASSGSILISLFFITSFMRYLLDFSPSLVLLATLGFWLVAIKSPKFAFVTGLILSLFTAITGLLLGLSGPNNHMLNNNFPLFQFLSSLFGG